MNTFILSSKTIPDIHLFHLAIKSIIPEFVGFLIEDNIITVELTIDTTSDLITSIEAIIPPSEPIQDVTPRQVRQAMILSGISVIDIDNAISSLPEPTQSLARIEWEYSTAFHRYRPLVIQIGQILGKTSDQLDALWKLAATL